MGSSMGQAKEQRREDLEVRCNKGLSGPKARRMFCILELNITTIYILYISDQLNGETLEDMYLFHNSGTLLRAYT